MKIKFFLMTATIFFSAVTIALSVIGSNLLIASFAILGTGIYRLYLHPLAKYPGPWLAKLTNLYSAYHAWRGDIHIDMWRCHQKYGDYVRYAPNRILFYNANAVNDIYGNRNNVIKSKVYNTLAHRTTNTLTLRDKAEHARRRRVMSPGFSDATIRLLESKILGQIEKLLLYLSDAEADGAGALREKDWSKPRDMAIWCDRHAFDLMSTLIYSASHDTLQHEDFRYVPRSIEESNVRMSVILQAPELTVAKLDKKLFPASIIARNNFLKFVASTVSSRVRDKATKPEEKKSDIFSIFQSSVDPETGEGFGVTELTAESATLIVAGSDTTSTTLAGAFYYLSEHRNAYERAADEVRRTFTSLEDIRIGPKLASCNYLRACIDETLRMSPPTGGALWREVLPGGTTIAGQFVPNGYDVGIGIYALHHNPAYHEDPFRFKPERFLGGADGAQDERRSLSRSAFMPFSVGTRGCIGKGLAMAEIMLTLASVMWVYNFRSDVAGEKNNLDPGNSDDKSTIHEEYQLRDHITAAKKGPRLQFQPRKVS